MSYSFGWFIGWLISAVIFGLITKYVSESKGYDGGFAWGFFLGLLGLLVVGFRGDNHAQSNNAIQSSTPLASLNVSQPPAEVTWECAQCSTVNPEAARFCQNCGERRHYEWRCSVCGYPNPAKAQFCFHCGKKKEESEEITPERVQEEVGPMTPSEIDKINQQQTALIRELRPEWERSLYSAAEIADKIRNDSRFDLDNEKVVALLQELDEAAKNENNMPIRFILSRYTA